MRTNVELLAPAGSFEALQAAVQNGCDAVYLGGTMFGARAFAHNFDDTQMETAVKYAHVYGVRVYVTVNTLLYEKEMEEVIAYVKRLQDMDVDALIIQDVGLFTLLHERFPDMELHHLHRCIFIIRKALRCYRKWGQPEWLFQEKQRLKKFANMQNLA